MATSFVPLVGSALADSLLLSQLADAWVQAGGTEPVNPALAREWLLSQGIQAAMTTALAAVLIGLWTDSWNAGLAAAAVLTGPAYVSAIVLADLLSQYSHSWAYEIVLHAIDRMALVLAAGGTAAEIAAALKAVLSDKAAALRIALTETIRAMGAAAHAHYRAAGIERVVWVTEGPAPCAICITNAAAEPRRLGVPFPSGDISPPAHPNCRCAVIPYLES